MIWFYYLGAAMVIVPLWKVFYSLSQQQEQDEDSDEYPYT